MRLLVRYTSASTMAFLTSGRATIDHPLRAEWPLRRIHRFRPLNASLTYSSLLLRNIRSLLQTKPKMIITNSDWNLFRFHSNFFFWFSGIEWQTIFFNTWLTGALEFQFQPNQRWYFLLGFVVVVVGGGGSGSSGGVLFPLFCLLVSFLFWFFWFFLFDSGY